MLKPDAQVREVDVPRIEPCFGRRFVEDAIGLAVVAVEGRVELYVRAHVRACVTAPGVEGGKDARHVVQLLIERLAVVELVDISRGVVADEIVVARDLLELFLTALW